MAETDGKVDINTIVITPSLVPGRVTIRVYKKGMFREARLVDGRRDAILKGMDQILSSMGLER